MTILTLIAATVPTLLALDHDADAQTVQFEIMSDPPMKESVPNRNEFLAQSTKAGRFTNKDVS